MTEEPKTIPFDMQTSKWTVAETWAYREAVKQQPAVAATKWEQVIDRIVREQLAAQEAAQKAGAEYTPPRDFPDYFWEEPLDTLVGFAWIAARRQDGKAALTFAEFAENVTQGDVYDAFLEGVFGALDEARKAAEAAEEERPTGAAGAASTSSTSRPPSASARSTAGRSRTSKR